MEINEIKKILLATLEKIDYEKDLKEIIKKFVQTYDGTNTMEFTALIQAMIIFLTHSQMLDAKASGYDQLSDKSKEFDTNFTQIKRDFDRINNGLDIEEPSQIPNNSN